MKLITAMVAAFLVAVGLLGFVGLGLEGPKLYLYPARSVYGPGEVGVFRVLAVDSEGVPAGGVRILAYLSDPSGTLVGEQEVVTDESGWAVFSFGLELEGVYHVEVEDVDLVFGGAETSVLVCAECPQDVVTTTVERTLTTSLTVGVLTTTVFSYRTSTARITDTRFVETTIERVETVTSAQTFTYLTTQTVRLVETVTRVRPLTSVVTTTVAVE